MPPDSPRIVVMSVFAPRAAVPELMDVTSEEKFALTCDPSAVVPFVNVYGTPEILAIISPVRSVHHRAAAGG